MATIAKESAKYKKTKKFLKSKGLQKTVERCKYAIANPGTSIVAPRYTMPYLLEFAHRYKRTRKTDRTIPELIHAQIVFAHLRCHLNRIDINDEGPELFRISKDDNDIIPLAVNREE